MEYSWNVNELARQKQILVNKLKYAHTDTEKYELTRTLLNYYHLLLFSDTNYFRKLKYNYESRKYQEISKKEHVVCDNNYLKHLLDVSDPCHKNIFYGSSTEKLSRYDVSLSETISLTREFFAFLGDDEISSIIANFLNPSSRLLYIFNNSNTCFPQSSRGITINDFVNKKSYCIMRQENTLQDMKTLSHELTHSVEFLLNPLSNALNHNLCFGYKEVPAFFVEQIILDFFLETQRDLAFSNDMTKILENRESYIGQLGYYVIGEIFSLVSNKIFSEDRATISSSGIKSVTCDINKFYNDGDIQTIINYNILHNLQQVESYFIALLMRNIYKEDKRAGLNLLRKVMLLTSVESMRKTLVEYGITDELIMAESNKVYFKK